MAGRQRNGTGGPPTADRVLVTHPGAELYGSDRMVLESVRGLVDDGWRVVVALPGEGPLTALLSAAGAECRTVPVPVLRKSATTPRGLVSLLLSSARSVPAAWRLLREVRPDAVCVSTVTTPLWLLLARVARRPVLCHVHEAEGSAHPALRLLLTAPLLLADRLLVNSHYALDVLVASVPRLAGRAQVVLNGVCGPSVPAGPPARTTGGPLRLAYVGRLSERKGVFVLLDALELLLSRGGDAVLTLVGDVFSEHALVAERLRRRLESPELAGRVHRSGFTDDVWEHLRAADVVLVPSLLPEPFGNTAVEGVLAARPVVASAVGGLPEAVEGVRSARLVAPGAPEELAQALADVSGDLDALLRCAQDDAAEAARRYAPARYRRDVASAVRALVEGRR